MFRIRVKYQKKGWARFVSQLEMVKVLERTLRRSEFPLVFSEGFSPRPKLSFGPPTPVGFESETELADVFLVSHLPEGVVKRRLEKFFPEGFKPLSVCYVSLEEVSLMKKIAFSEYEVLIPFATDQRSVFLQRLKNYLSSVSEIIHRGKVIKIDREADFPKFSISQDERGILLKLFLATREDKTIRPDLLLFDFLVGENLSFSEAIFTRKNLFFLIGERLVKVI